MQRLVVGGGVAGTSCAGMLARLCPNDSVTLIAPSNTVHVRRLNHSVKPFDRLTYPHSTSSA